MVRCCVGSRVGSRVRSCGRNRSAISRAKRKPVMTRMNAQRFVVSRVAAVVLLAAACALPALAASCESLASLSLPNTKITMAQQVTGGSFTAPGANNPMGNLPAFCRVAATLTPSSDSDIRIELWLPVSGWNQKFQGVGNGGWAGSITYGAMAAALRRGYATSSTDTGHEAPVTSAEWALGHPEKVVDYAWRSEHEMT